MFINSLKEQGINYYRNEMRTFSQSKCSIHGKKKLVIVDDLDLINDQSQQVFRNYIDKYKSNINFVSVCSNVHKVIESIQSRIHILRLDPPNRCMVEKLTDNIINSEKLQLTEEARKYILEFSNYSIREVITHLEKINIISTDVGRKIDANDCKKIISNISYQYFEDYISFLRSNQLPEAIHILYTVYDYGYSVIDILDLFYAFVKTSSLLSENEKYLLIPFLCKYIAYFHTLHEDTIEIVLFTNSIQSIFANDKIDNVLDLL
tara:strand:+ start:1 stop:789 length:789 start_codon:yes stop_codon:yes gene_type:complete